MDDRIKRMEVLVKEASSEAQRKTFQEILDKLKQSYQQDSLDSSYKFQAIGKIFGEVTLGDRSTVKVGDKVYRLFYTPNKRKRVYDALQKEIELTGNSTFTLIVYPKILHFPYSKPHVLAFQLVGFEGRNAKKTALNSVNNNEFLVKGIYEKLPCCKYPVITILRNKHEYRGKYIESATTHQKESLLKPTYIPVSWFKNPVEPFRYNTKVKHKEQKFDQRFFVCVVVSLNPETNVFKVIRLENPPTNTLPPSHTLSQKVKKQLREEAEEKNKDKKPPKKKKIIGRKIKTD